jgi:sulfite exporter TauE/SafE
MKNYENLLDPCHDYFPVNSHAGQLFLRFFSLKFSQQNGRSVVLGLSNGVVPCCGILSKVVTNLKK